MNQLLFGMLLAAAAALLFAAQTDEEAAVQTLFRTKYAVDRATHAAALQLDTAKLARGVTAVDPVAAESAAEAYLAANMPSGERWERVDFLVVPETAAFPYVYRSPDSEFRVMLRRPGVILLIRIEYRRAFRLLGDIVWIVGGSHEVTEPAPDG